MRVSGKNGFSIPWWVVIVSLCVAAPVGVILILLKLYLESDSKNIRRSDETARLIKKKQKPLSRLLQIFAVIHLMTAALILCIAVGDGIAGSTAAMLGGIGPTLYFSFGGAACGIASAVFRRREQDATRYLTLIGEKDSVSLMRLSEATAYRIGRVKRDVQRLIDGGLLGKDAYIDAANLCYMRCPSAVPDGKAGTQISIYKRAISGAAGDTVEKTTGTTDTPPAIGMEDYDAVIRKFRALDAAIRDEAVSVRIRRIENITRNIFEYIARNPDKKNQIRTFVNYYLPTTTKLLESYRLIERVGVTGQNMRDAKNNIEKTLDSLVAGFEQQFDQLYRAESVDISSDIEVLEQMMARDGLKENRDFPSPRHTAHEASVFSEISGDPAGGTACRNRKTGE